MAYTEITWNGSEVCWDDPINRAANPDIMQGLKDMAVFYEGLLFSGELEGGVFYLQSIYDIINHEYLPPTYINEMYYVAFGPECINIENINVQ